MANPFQPHRPDEPRDEVSINGPWRPGWWIDEAQLWDLGGIFMGRRIEQPLIWQAVRVSDSAIYRAAPWLCP